MMSVMGVSHTREQINISFAFVTPSKTHKGGMDFTTKRGDKDFHRKGKDVRKARRPFEY